MTIETKKEKNINKKYGFLRKLLAYTIPDSQKLKIIANMSTLKTWEQKQTSCRTFETRYEMYDFIQFLKLGGRLLNVCYFSGSTLVH